MVDLAGWVASLDAVVELIAGRLRRAEPRRRVGTYLRGLLAGLERKNGWTLAEHAGAVSPDGMQRLLRTADWDVDGVRDDLRGYVIDELGDPVSGVFIVDETGFIKKGLRSAGVQRQYTGTSGKIDNCQLGVFLAYASTKGRALIDRELYLPVSWTSDRERCARADVPDDIEFATKPQLGTAMLARAHAAGALTPASWVTADEAYGQNPGFRDQLAEWEIPFVLATRNDDVLTSPDGNRRPAKVLATIAGARQLITDPDTEGCEWERRSIGPGAHGMRVYDWTAVALDAEGLPAGWGHWLLVRRQTEPAEGKTVRELAFYRCAAPADTPLRELIRVAGARWAIEECFQTAKNEAGLDHYQARSYRAWHAHITLAMLAAAYLAVTRATEHAREAEKRDPQPVGAH
ncbi:IS701 family transposase [Pseudonocardia sp. N23]|uniref:IS701 family transposase n=1 Tax=Pseudonocardia sp. N23 TaxID=1987376 RepID=UPI000BFDBAD6|nr:IS701 family transposase [Pseudonocardia sp. N23]RTL68948.1 MAG: IS701 family transposase [Pseudonocardiaceae bacterium]GAY08095.1 mobile element protein [Pseudonocardia sp. N23]